MLVPKIDAFYLIVEEAERKSKKKEIEKEVCVEGRGRE